MPFRVGTFSGSVEARVGTSGTHSSRGRMTDTVIGCVHVCQGSRWRWMGTTSQGQGQEQWLTQSVLSESWVGGWVGGCVDGWVGAWVRG